MLNDALIDAKEIKYLSPETSAIYKEIQDEFEIKREEITNFTALYKEKMLNRSVTPLEEKIQDLEYKSEYLKKWCDLLLWQWGKFSELLVDQEDRIRKSNERISKRTTEQEDNSQSTDQCT